MARDCPERIYFLMKRENPEKEDSKENLTMATAEGETGTHLDKTEIEIIEVEIEKTEDPDATTTTEDLPEKDTEEAIEDVTEKTTAGEEEEIVMIEEERAAVAAEAEALREEEEEVVVTEAPAQTADDFFR